MSLHTKGSRRAAFRRYARLPDTIRAAVAEALAIATRAVFDAFAGGLVDVINGRATMEEVRAHLEERLGRVPVDFSAAPLTSEFSPETLPLTAGEVRPEDRHPAGPERSCC